MGDGLAKMDFKGSIALVIPAYKPSDRLVGLLDELVPTWAGEVVVVDDGGGSDFAGIFERVRALGVTVLAHERNRGKGAALKTAFSYLVNRKPEIVGAVTADADGQHLPDDIRAVACDLADHPEALVLGCRRFDGDDVPVRSRIGNTFMLGAMRILCGVDVSDTQTGLRGIPMSLMRRMLSVKRDGYEFETEMLVLSRRGGGIREVPISTVYEGNNEVSHFRPVVDSLRVLGVLFSAFFKYTLSSLGSSLLDWALFSLLVVLLPAGVLHGSVIAVATVIARLISATFNYVLNRKVVFKAAGARRARSIRRYIVLCIVCMMASAALVSALAAVLPVPVVIIKPFVDTALFFANYRIQQSWVFA